MGVDAGVCNRCPFRDHVCTDVRSCDANNNISGRSLIQRARRFFYALKLHIRAGLPTALPADQDTRRSICDPCDYRNHEKDECKKCSCSLGGGEKRILSKIAWAGEKCLVGKWGPVKGETIWQRAFRWLVRQAFRESKA